jgi:hypothetical protein
MMLVVSVLTGFALYFAHRNVAATAERDLRENFQAEISSLTIANTAAFHFPTIEQGGNSLYPSLALRATHTEVLRILISIGLTETMHFQTWSDKAGNAPPLTAVNPVTGVSVTFPDLEIDDELLNKSLIMPEPCPFLDRSLPIVSIIRPTETSGVAMHTLQFLTDMGLFIGQSPAFFAYVTQLPQAPNATHHGRS